MSKKFINDFYLDIQCPCCNKKLKISSKDVGSTITCKYCHKDIELEDDGFSDGIKQVNKEFEKFTKDLNKLFK